MQSYTDDALPNFRPGHLVQLASGGPLLTVVPKTDEELMHEAAASEMAEPTVKCMWFAKSDLRTALIPTSALIPFDPDPPPTDQEDVC